ncbi:hypothetical protein D043_3322A, partial [Vibrio parahaemolyticus EKP-021]
MIVADFDTATNLVFEYY